MEAIQVVTEVQRRRRFSVEQKIRCVQESNLPGMTVSYIARKYGISPSLLFHWRNRMVEGGKKAVAVDDEVVASAESSITGITYLIPSLATQHEVTQIVMVQISC